MAFNVFKESGQGFYFIFLIITGLIGLLALVLRFVATKVANRKLGWEDVLAAGAVAVFLTRTAVGLRALIIINGRADLTKDQADWPAFEAASKMVFVADIITMLDQTLSKLSVCALYIRIFGIMRNYRMWIYSLAAAQILCYIGLIIMQTLQCRPVNKFWQFWVEGKCFPFSWILLVLEIPNSLIDFALVALAMVMIKGIQLRTGSMWKLRFLFGLGSFAGIFGFVKIGLSYDPNDQYTTAVIGLWAAIQSTACIICCCAPVCGKLFSDWGLWSGLTLKARSLNSFINSIKTGGSSMSDGSTKVEKSNKGSSYDERLCSTDDQQQQVPRQTWLRPDVESTEWLVTGQRAQKPHAQTAPIRSIQVERSIDVVRGVHPGLPLQTTQVSVGY